MLPQQDLFGPRPGLLRPRRWHAPHRLIVRLQCTNSTAGSRPLLWLPGRPHSRTRRAGLVRAHLGLPRLQPSAFPRQPLRPSLTSRTLLPTSPTSEWTEISRAKGGHHAGQIYHGSSSRGATAAPAKGGSAPTHPPPAHQSGARLAWKPRQALHSGASVAPTSTTIVGPSGERRFPHGLRNTASVYQESLAHASVPLKNDEGAWERSPLQ